MGTPLAGLDVNQALPAAVVAKCASTLIVTKVEPNWVAD